MAQNNNHGGKRPGAGRKKGYKKPESEKVKTIVFARRVTDEEYKFLENSLKEFRLQKFAMRKQDEI